MKGRLAGLLSSQLRGLNHWLPTYAATSARRSDPRPDQPVHVLLCIADHFEPLHSAAPTQVARSRLRSWLDKYPAQFERFADFDGRPPRHTFFYPAEEYDESLVTDLTALCRQGFGEIEVHLHHEDDCADNLRHTLTEYTQMLAHRHGQLARDESGRLGYAFIHGNWALDNSHPDGRWCGVDNEIDVLRDTGCYADLTLPSYPSPCQTRTINSLFYAVGQSGRRKSHDEGVEVGVAPRPDRGLLMVQGPLVLDWTRRRCGLLPRVENGCLQATQPPDVRRLHNWIRAKIQVPTRPDWYFVKLHAHGCYDDSQDVLLGEAMVQFHAGLAQRASSDATFRFHYVSAREMVNLILAAAEGWTGSVAGARDYVWKAVSQSAPRAHPSPSGCTP